VYHIIGYRMIIKVRLPTVSLTKVHIYLEQVAFSSDMNMECI